MIKELLSVFKGHSLMERAYQRSYEMLYLTEDMFKTAKNVLRNTETTDIDIDIDDQDIEVNRFQREVRKDVFSDLLMSGSEKLPSGLALVSIVIDVERIGDYTKNIVEIAKSHTKKLTAGDFEEDLQKIEKAIEENFAKTIDCFINSDEKVAMELLTDYKWVSRLCDQKINQLIRGEDASLSVSSAVALAIYLRSIKRIYSHLRNVTTSVINPFHRIGYKPKKRDL
ncbi:MAG: hypothetical protein KJ799_17255 [Bacteroidetes bacterium]|nr:hypothetical protein [Bacteroidota bacterium]